VRTSSYLFGLIVMLFSFPSTSSELPYASNVTSGFRGLARISYVNPPPEEKKLLLKTVNATSQAKKVLDDLFKINNSKALLASRGNDLLYERYSNTTGPKDTPLGYSMSKSLTALTVGRALCDGNISSIDDELKKYVPALGGTAWGDATIRSLLKMSSGAYKTEIQFNGHKSPQMQEAIGGAIVSGRMSESFIDIMLAANEKNFEHGKQNNYNNLDTVALGFLVESATGMSFASYFEKTIWAETGAESRGAWLINNKNETSTYNGFSARPHDWLRIGVMVLRELKNSESCFGKFLKDATSRKIAVFGPGPARGYGYQIWHQCGTSDFCFVGFGGQYLIFNVEKNIVVYQHATTLSNVVRGTTSVMSSLIQGLETVDAIN
jgi:CubicO group peptidase (beta-lactamase class C family)